MLFLEMKAKTLTLLIIIFFSFSQALVAQCPKGKVFCDGECGRFEDENGDGLCDLPNVKKQESIKSSTQTPDTTTESILNEVGGEILDQGEEEIVVEAQVEEVVVHPKNSSKHKSSETIEEEKAILEAQNPQNNKPYRLISITIITLIAYFFTMMLVKIGKMKKFVHRRIWNTTLLITFLMSCLLGLLLVIQINYHILSSLYLTNLKLHVEFGIAMTLIAIIHILWHLPYFKKLLKTQKSALKDIVNE